MRLSSAKYSLLLLLACSFAGKIEATDSEAADEHYRSSCYECSCEPLHPCALDVQLQVGVAPITWRHRGEFTAIRCSAEVPAVTVLELPRFNKLFRVPWTVGGQIGYALSCNARLFVEFDYYQARSKNNTAFATINVIPQTFICLDFNKYKAFDFYMGARYYSNRYWCNRLSWFIGGKIGFARHKAVQLDGLTLGSDFEGDYFNRSTVFAGGGHIGLDYCVWGNLSIVLTAEIVARCGPRAVNNIVLGDVDAFTLDASNLLPAHVGTELIFPIILGLRYSF